MIERELEQDHTLTFRNFSESLAALKARVKEALPAENYKEYSAKWSNRKGIHPEDHKTELAQFCEEFYQSVKRLIDQGASNLSDFSKVRKRVN